MTADLLAPEPPDIDREAHDAALALLATRPLVALTGAGLSTDSGIPDYRGPGRPVRTPMTFQEFSSGPDAQRRYWARAYVGWATMHGAEPNAGHRALTRIAPDLLITQNVDGLHERAGTPRVVALHGRVSEVVCLGCRRTTSRAAVQARLGVLNPGFLERAAGATVRPDGDVELSGTDDFSVAHCADCGGVLKPHVVFFGENVPPDRVTRCYAAVDALRESDGALLVAGSSLAVMSGLRFVKRAASHGVPVVVVNRGTTRGDDLAAHRLHAGCSEFLTALADLRTAAPEAAREA
ncbi:MAG: Sir2 family NAD-dependent protein deacetylase [Nocardioidaceae bacterium]